VRLEFNKGAFGKGRKRWSDSVHTIVSRNQGTNSFTVSGRDDAWKYDQLLKVSSTSKDIVKSTETVKKTQTHEHAKKLARANLVSGTKAAKELIQDVAQMPEGRPTRELRPRTRLHDEPDRPQLAKAPSRAPSHKPAFEVEGIVKTRIAKGRKEWLVKWKGYDWSDNSWEPRGSFDEDPDTYQRMVPPNEPRRSGRVRA
jgi:hypothetical protein